jgi:hypothetical protein
MNDDTKTREWPPPMPPMPWSDRVVPPEARTLCDMLTEHWELLRSLREAVCILMADRHKHEISHTHLEPMNGEGWRIDSRRLTSPLNVRLEFDDGPITLTIRPNASDVEVIAALRDAIDRWGSEESNLRATTKPICTDAK